MRFFVRHAQQTIADHIEAELTALGWINEPRVFDLPRPVKFHDTEPDESADVDDELVVAVIVPEVGVTEAYELGAGLIHAMLDLQVHVRTPRLSVTMSLANDIYDVLTDRVIELHDHTASPSTPVEGSQIEFSAVVVDQPRLGVGSLPMRQPWRVVTALASVYRRQT